MQLADASVAFLQGGSVLDHADRALLMATAAEAFAADGRIRTAAPWASRAIAVARDSRLTGLVFYACGLLALCHALNGQYSDAEQALGEAEAAEAESGVDRDRAPSGAHYPLLLARILVASSRLDGVRLDRIADQLERVAVPLWTGTGRGARAMAALTRGEAAIAIPLLHEVIGGSESAEIARMVRGFCLGVYADVLLTRGEARRTLTFLLHAESPFDHVLCFDMQRSAAHLLLSQPREALLATDACVRLGPAHCSRTLVPILLRRSVAFDLLAQPRRAAETFAEAVGMLESSGSLTPLLTLAPDALAALLERATSSGSVSGSTARAIRRQIESLPAVDVHRGDLPRLTGREELIATTIRSRTTTAEVAAELHVSSNTVKSQLRSLYRKLGVTTRADAVSVLERAGFYD